MTTETNTVNSMVKDFLMENIFDDCYVFEYIEQIITKKIFEEEEIFNHIKPVRRKDIVKINEDVFEHKSIIEDANNLGKKFSFFFFEREGEDVKNKKLYRELLVVDIEYDAPRIIYDTEGSNDNALLQYSVIIPISLYEIEL